MRGRPKKTDSRRHSHSFALNDMEERIFIQLKSDRSVTDLIVWLMRWGHQSSQMELMKERDALQEREEYHKTVVLETEKERIGVEKQLEEVRLGEGLMRDRRLSLLEDYKKFEKETLLDIFTNEEHENFKQNFIKRTLEIPIDMGFESWDEALVWLKEQKENQIK